MNRRFYDKKVQNFRYDQKSTLFLTSRNSFNPHAAGRDPRIPFSLSNFIKQILKATSFKMSPMSNLGLKLKFWIFRYIINMSHFFNNVKVKNSWKIFENSFLKNGIAEFRSEALLVSILTNSLKAIRLVIKKKILAEIVIMNFHKNTKNVTYVLHQISDHKKYFQKP